MEKNINKNILYMDSQVAQGLRIHLTMQEMQETRGFDPWVRKIPWGRKWQTTPVFLPGKFHGQQSLTGYSPWGHKESDTTELLTEHMSTNIYTYN